MAFKFIAPSPVVLYRNGRGQWVNGRRPSVGESVKLQTGKPFAGIALYYANIIDYCRVLLSVVALVLILHWEHYRCAWVLCRLFVLLRIVVMHLQRACLCVCPALPPLGPTVCPLVLLTAPLCPACA